MVSSICALRRSGICTLGNEEETSGTFLQNPEEASLLAGTGVTVVRGRSCMPVPPAPYRSIMAWTVLSAVERGAEVTVAVCEALSGLSVGPDEHADGLDGAT